MRHLLALLCGAAVAIPLATAAGAADAGYLADPIYDSPMFNFEGFYAGVQGGGAWLTGPGFVGTAGIMAGTNFSLSEAILGGLEFQGGASFNGAGVTGIDALLLAHVGTYLTQDLMVYGALGGGLVNGANSYAFGAGLEMPVADQLSVRGEVLATGPWIAAPTGIGARAGLLFHIN